jgi:hypothetical protein
MTSTRPKLDVRSKTIRGAFPGGVVDDGRRAVAHPSDNNAAMPTSVRDLVTVLVK